MGILKGISSSLRKAAGWLIKLPKRVKTTFKRFEHITPHAPKIRFHKIANRFIDEYGFTIKNAKRYARLVLKLPKADRDAKDRDIIAEISP